jgi:MoaA/NifB/PqqE/SkfB family radical SAM enzyme
MSNKCQLACAHCGPDLSSSWAKIKNINPKIKKSFTVSDSFIDELIHLLPQIKVLKFTGGEPFLDPDHWKILDKIKHVNRKHCELLYITNGLVKTRYDLWDGFKSVSCSVSVDGFEKSYEWFRRGSNWKELIENVKILEKYSKVSINYSITPYTINDYFNAKSFWKDYDFSAVPIVIPDYCSLLKFPKTYAQKISDWEKYHTLIHA